MADTRDDRTDQDLLLARVVDELSALPAADEGAVSRIVALAARQAQTGELDLGARAVEDDETALDDAVLPLDAARRRRGRGRRWAVAAAVTLAAGLTGLLLVRPDRAGTRATASTTAAAPAGALRTAAADRRSLDEAPIVTQFVVDLPDARTVSLVGDFNDWNPAAAPLVRHAGSGRWTTEVPLTPGRHRYAYVVNGGAWTLDPGAAQAVDPDFGSPTSVIVVGVR